MEDLPSDLFLGGRGDSIKSKQPWYNTKYLKIYTLISYFLYQIPSNATILYIVYQRCIKLKLINPLRDIMIHEHRKPSCKPCAIISPRLTRVWKCFPTHLPQHSLRILIGEPNPMVVFSNLDIPI